VNTRILTLTLLLTACSSFQPVVKHSVIDGTKVVEHIDTDDAPAACGDRTEWAGCHQVRGDTHHIWRASTARPDTLPHEIAHAKGMRHTAWRFDMFGNASATVVLPGGRYKVGDVIYVDARGERIVSEGRI
jgi:hypothetical protein